MVPILLGALFKEYVIIPCTYILSDAHHCSCYDHRVGTANMPMLAMSDAKRTYMRLDMNYWCRVCPPYIISSIQWYQYLACIIVLERIIALA